MKMKPVAKQPKKHIVDIKVVGMEKTRKDKIAGKRCEFVLLVKWSNNTQAYIYRPHSMFFDFQGAMEEMFPHHRIPSAPVVKFHWNILKKVGSEKDCKAVEEFCMKMIKMPEEISQASMVLHFFDAWGTDQRTTDNLGRLPTETSEVGRSSFKSTHDHQKIPLVQNNSAENEMQYKSIAHYRAASLGEVSLAIGKPVTIIEKNEKGWWFVANDAGQQGWAPATYLEPVGNHRDKDFDYDWVSVVDATGKGESYMSVCSYVGANPDELSYDVHEEVEVLEKSNYGWWNIRMGNKTGITPATNLQKENEELVYETTNNANTRGYSINSAAGLYAVVRKPPPRRESVKSQQGQATLESITNDGKFLTAQKKPKNATSFSGGSFIESKNSFKALLKEDDKNGTNLERSTSEGNLLKESYENVDIKDKRLDHLKASRSQSVDSGITSAVGNLADVGNYMNSQVKPKPGSNVEEVEIYSATLDYVPSPHKRDDLPLQRGDLVQIISADSGWLFVMMTSSGRQGWVPESYLERRYDVTDKMNIPPRPRPRPRPSPRPIDAPTDAPTPSPPLRPREQTPAVPPRKHHCNANENNNNDVKSDVTRNDVIPRSLLNDIQNVRKYEEDLYDQPDDCKLRSVYDSEAWFFGNISRADCERILSTYGRQQEFIVRESQRAPGSYALSVKYCYRIRHFPIEAKDGCQLLIGKLTFPNVMEIVSYYQNHPLFYSEHKEPITLGNAFSKDKIPK